MDLRFSRSFSLQGTEAADRWGFSFVDVPVRVKNPVDPYPAAWAPALVMGDGSTRPLTPGVVSGYLVTTEFWRYDASGRTLYLPNGWVATYESSGNPSGGIMLVEVHDPFGNQITPTWDTSTARPWRLSSVAQTVSGTSRTVTFAYTGNNSRLPSSMTYSGRTWTYTYASTSDKSLTNAQPPEGPDWEFATTFASVDGSGNPILSSISGLTVTLPTGGTVAYQFSAVTLQDSQRRVTGITTGGRTISGDTWDLGYSLSGSTVTTQVTTPSNRVIEYVHDHWSNALGTTWTLTERTLTESATELTRLDCTYHSITLMSGLTMPALDEAETTQDGVTFSADHAYSSSTFADYLRPNQITETVSSPSATRVTAFTFDYSFTPYIINRVASQTVTIGSQSTATSHQYADSTGALTSTTAGGFTTTFGIDSRGNTNSITDPGSHETTVAFSYGAAGTVTTPNLTITRTNNADGTTASEAIDGETTSYTYDDLGRVTVIDPPHGPDVTRDYPADGTTVIQERDGVSVEATLDGFGRTIATETVSGVKTVTTYDAEGRRTFQSYPYTGSPSTPAGDAFAYDGLGPAHACHAHGRHRDRVRLQRQQRHDYR